jgi:tetratricopeptide (TPR) repeat protein
VVVVVVVGQPPVGGVATRLEGFVFGREQAAAFLQRRTGSSDRQAAEALAGELGGLPLALEQAAAFMEQTGLGLGEYLAVYRRDREVLLAKGEPVASGATVDATVRLAIQQVAQRSPAAEALLELCAFLAPEAIPHRLLCARPQVLPGRLRRVVADELAYAEAVGVLHGFSLLELEQAGVRVHRLVQAVTRRRLGHKERAAWAARAVTLSLAAWPEESWLPAAWPWGGRLLPHALAAAEHAEQLATARESTGALLNQVGLYRAGRAELPAARVTLQRALAIKEAAYESDHPQVAVTLDNLGVVLGGLGELPAARARLERALAIRKLAYGPQHPQLARTLGNLGNVLVELGKLPQAHAHHERALAIFEAAYGPDHPLVARALTNLGLVLRELGKLPQARARLERALAIREAAYGADHPEVARTLGNLGGALRQLGALAEARARLERALAIFEAAYGPDHLLVARTLTNLGIVLRQLGKLSEAQACEQRAQAIRQKVDRGQ